jgi:UDPglucose 6-dehydrogenase
MEIGIFGTGYVGLVTGACLADLGHTVFCIDIDQNKIESLQNGHIPFYEPGLKELVQRNKNKGRLHFSTDISLALKPIIFNCVGTPMAEDGSANLQYVFSVVDVVAKSNGFKVLINKSTVPPGTAKQCQERIRQINPTSETHVISNPEFLKEGNAVHDFTHPDMIVIGSQNQEANQLVKKMYSGLARPYLPVIETNWETSEMIKYANNSFLATKISFINEIANICDNVGADIKTVSKAMGNDYRISPKFLNAGIGYGGSCFPKDIRALVTVAKNKGYEAKLLNEVDSLNKRQKHILATKIQNHFGQIQGKTFAVWGLSFKPKTSDVREAPAFLLIQWLLDNGAKVNVYDPIVSQTSFGDNVTHYSSPQETVTGASAIILATEWDEFRNVNFSELGNIMTDKVLFDGRNIYSSSQTNGFTYYGVGR